jgi:hypothetical protein
MKDLLREIIKMSSGIDAKGIKFVGTADKLEVSMVDNEKDLVLHVNVKKPLPEFEGIFGIGNVRMMDNLLAYYSKEPKIERFKHRVSTVAGALEEMDVPKRMIFKDEKGGSASFFFSHGGNVLGLEYPTIGWDVTLVPRREALDEFSKLASIFNTPDCSFFRVTLDDHVLKFAFGTEGQTTHHGDMIFEQNVKGSLVANLAWQAQRVLLILKSIGKRDMEMTISNRGLIRFSTETEFARYEYWLRCFKI